MKIVKGARSDVGAAERQVAQLNAQAAGLRIELARLGRELAREQHSQEPARRAQLVEANEHLVLALLHERAAAHTAKKALSDLFSAGQRDELTGLLQRPLMRERLENAIVCAAARRTRFALLSIDLDNFKSISDSLGQAVGDQALQTASRRLQSAVRHSDTVSRHGNEEFLVLLSEIAEPSDAAQVGEKIAVALLAPCAIDDHVLRLSACIGIAVYPQDGEDAALLINHADAAMHRARARGPGQVAFHGDHALSDPTEAKSRIRSTRRAPNLVGPTPAESDLLLRDLREANERLLISAADAQERESNADEAHRRQVKLQAVVVHELRNPLIPIRMAAEMLKRVPSDDQMIAKLPGLIERQVSLMVRLIDDLLDSSRVNTGKFRLDYASVALNQVISTAVEIAKAAMDSRRQTFRVSVAEPLPVFYGDAARLTQIVGNLLDNASKYTPEGGDVALMVEYSDGSVAITVADNGIGIGEGMLSKVFDLFVQDNTGLVRHNSGLGIGLAVVRELVNAHGGSVIVESAGRNHGCKFVVTLPVREGSSLGEP